MWTPALGRSWRKMKTILENIKIIVEILAIIAGMLVAIPLFRKKILDEKLNETLKELNEINKRNLPTVIHLLDKYSYKEELYGPIGIKEIQNIYKDFLELKHVLAFSQSEMATISSLLESFLRRTIHWYKNSRKIGKLIVLERTDLFFTITKTLWDLHFFMLKDIPIPNNTFIRKKLFVNSTIKKFTSKSKYNTYRGFEIGYSTDKTSSIFPLFLENINKYGNDIFYKAILDSYGFDIQYSISRLLYLSKIYSPVLLKASDSFFGSCYLCLIGFKIQRNLTTGKHTVDLYYGNPINNIRISGIIMSMGLKLFKDDYLYFDNTIPDYESISDCGFDIFKIVIQLETLKKEFFKYKNHLENKMIDECNDIFKI